MLETGIVVALGLIAILAKLPWRMKLWVVSHPLLIDIAVFVVLTALHWGTFSGVMAATAAALFVSIVLTIARRVIGRVEKGMYFPGWFDVSHKLMRAQ
jgi:hypothetical protein